MTFYVASSTHLPVMAVWQEFGAGGSVKHSRFPQATRISLHTQLSVLKKYLIQGHSINNFNQIICYAIVYDDSNYHPAYKEFLKTRIGNHFPKISKSLTAIVRADH